MKPENAGTKRDERRIAYAGVLVAEGQAQARTKLAAASDHIVVVERGVIRTVLFVCPSGCGDVLAINVDPAAGEAWRVRYSEGAVSLIPSVWRTTGCEAHFVLWRNRVWWCGPDEDEDNAWPDDMDQTLRAEWQRIRRLRRSRDGRR
jgi:hypothetical protein